MLGGSNNYTKTHKAGRGSDKNGGTPASVGYKYALGNTEEDLRLVNLGCAARGDPSQGHFDHRTGRGWVRERRGCYDDAVRVKRSIVDIILHETLGGGFPPPAVAKMHRYSRRATSVVDRTRYTARHRRLPYRVHHTQRMSLAVVKADSRGIMDSFAKLSASLCAPPPPPHA